MGVFRIGVQNCDEGASDMLPAARAGKSIAWNSDGTALEYVAVTGGAAASEDFEFTQAVSSTLWVIAHNKGKRPQSVNIVDSNGDQVNASVSHPTLNTTTISFSLPTTGTANLEFLV